jgi:hypothetical protein
MDFHTIKVVLCLSVPFLLATLWAVIHAAQKEFGSLREKVLWMMIAAVPFVGFIIYLLFGLRKGKKSGEANE